MPLRLYNTLSNTLEDFTPVNKGEVKMYTCGPTVYHYVHIGNFRTFIFNDFLRRYLKFRGYKVDHAMNITDVDDKTIAGAGNEGITLQEYTQKYTDIFFEDLKTLNIEDVEHNPRATESIDAMIDIIEHLDKNDLTYIKDGSVYFSISKYDRYGRLSNLNAREIRSGLRYDTDEYEKDDIRDFALWKAAKEGEISWETPWGKGRPGWHIECSAMIRKIFGRTIDIHTGGVDLIFPHHENEIAQSEAAYGETFVRHWIHVEHLLVDGSKMSKSKGNFYTLRDLIEKGFSPRSIRYLLISSHYRKQLNFTFDGLHQADQAIERLDNLVLRLNDIKSDAAGNPELPGLIDTMLVDFAESVDDDLNISRGMGIFFDFVHKVNSLIDAESLGAGDAQKILEALHTVDSVLGIIFFRTSDSTDVDDERIESLINERNEARKNKDFQRADEIRNMLTGEGIILEDTKDGTRWKIKK